MEESDMTFCEEREAGMIPLHPSMHCGSPSGAASGTPTTSNADSLPNRLCQPHSSQVYCKGGIPA